MTARPIETTQRMLIEERVPFPVSREGTVPATAHLGTSHASAVGSRSGGRTRPAKPPRTRRRTWIQFGLASLGLALVLGMALGTMVLGGLVLHALIPDKAFDIFAALHNEVVLGVLLGLVVLWLLPPYPWAKPWSPTGSRASAQVADETKGGGAGNATNLGQYWVGPVPPAAPQAGRRWSDLPPPSHHPAGPAVTNHRSFLINQGSTEKPKRGGQS